METIQIELTSEQESFVRSYVAAALWSTTDESDESGGVPLDRDHDESDLAPEALQAAVVDCLAFLNRYGCYISASAERDDYRPTGDGGDVFAHAGHDFWLTRCGHGAGFWDGDWPECYGTMFDKGAKGFGNVDLYKGDDGRLYFA